MHIDPTTHIIDGKRQWTSSSLHQITHLMGLLFKKDDKDAVLFGANGFIQLLGEGLMEAGFRDEGDYTWKSDWGCGVKFRALSKDNELVAENLCIIINDKAHEIKDIYPLWPILRKVWNESNRA